MAGDCLKEGVLVWERMSEGGSKKKEEGTSTNKAGGGGATTKKEEKEVKKDEPLTPLQQLYHEVRLLRRATDTHEPRYTLRALRHLSIIR